MEKKIEMTFKWVVSGHEFSVEHKDIPGATHIVFDSDDPQLAGSHWGEIRTLLHQHLDDMLKGIYTDLTLIP